jgi:hypothetical protein
MFLSPFITVLKFLLSIYLLVSFIYLIMLLYQHTSFNARDMEKELVPDVITSLSWINALIAAMIPPLKP